MPAEPARLNMPRVQDVRDGAAVEEGTVVPLRLPPRPETRKLDPVSLAVWVLFFVALVGFWLVAGWWMAGYLR